MKHFILLLLIVSAQITIGQSSNTFFIKKKSDGDVKNVFVIGDKLKLKYTNDVQEITKIKGRIRDITEEGVVIEGQTIHLSNIISVSAHNTNRKIIGGILVAGGIGIAIAGSSQPSSSGNLDLSDIGRGLIGVVGTMVAVPSAIFMVILPKKYKVEKFQFSTFLAP